MEGLSVCLRNVVVASIARLRRRNRRPWRMKWLQRSLMFARISALMKVLEAALVIAKLHASVTAKLYVESSMLTIQRFKSIQWFIFRLGCAWGQLFLFFFGKVE